MNVCIKYMCKWFYTLCLNKTIIVYMLNCKTFSHHKTFWAIYVIRPISEFIDLFSRNGMHHLASCIERMNAYNILDRAFIKFLSLDTVCQIIALIGCCICGEAGWNHDPEQFPFREQQHLYRHALLLWRIVLTVCTYTWMNICIARKALFHSLVIN